MQFTGGFSISNGGMVMTASASGGAGDPLYNDVALLVNAEAGLVDEGPNSLAVTAASGATTNAVTVQRGSQSIDLTSAGAQLYVNDTSLQLAANDFTIEMWVYMTGGDSARTIYDSRSSGGTILNGFSLEIISNALNTVTNNNIDIGRGSIPDNTWTHIAVVRVGATMEYFFNGVSAGSITYTTNMTNSDVYVGTNFVGAATFNGYIDDLRITRDTGRYQTDFTPPGELPTNFGTPPVTIPPAFYNSSFFSTFDTAIQDESVNNLGLTVQAGSPSITASSKVGAGALACDSDSAIQIDTSPTFFLNGDFTIEFWINPIESGTRKIMGIVVANSHNNQIQLHDDGRLMMYNANTLWIESTTFTATSGWQHYAICRSGNTLRFFKDGVGEVVSTNSTQTYDFRSSTINAVTNALGGASTRETHYDNFRVAQGMADYTANFTPVGQ